MNHAIRSARAALPYNASRKATGNSVIGVLRKVTTMASSQSDSKNPNEKNGDTMSDSFGEGYATRSDEEGFGGVYGENQSLPKTGQNENSIHENHPAYDKTHGSEVKEKEKARHQTSAKS
ncbi:hypothetical protein F2P56_014101 [Juglans regia]|uniref:Uncharacterized protein n=2 Tax=Juglans regia TaxID=51240 RepID=A0A834CST6_JUGRE|nr:uncharacterized protein LOC108995311 [Juglans regia]KAF5463983.1 hypothetical protein F2P56_014101 [Juglans regia]